MLDCAECTTHCNNLQPCKELICNTIIMLKKGHFQITDKTSCTNLSIIKRFHYIKYAQQCWTVKNACLHQCLVLFQDIEAKLGDRGQSIRSVHLQHYGIMGKWGLCLPKADQIDCFTPCACTLDKYMYELDCYYMYIHSYLTFDLVL